jgi:hypothetical protein
MALSPGREDDLPPRSLKETLRILKETLSVHRDAKHFVCIQRALFVNHIRAAAVDSDAYVLVPKREPELRAYRSHHRDVSVVDQDNSAREAPLNMFMDRSGDVDDCDSCAEVSHPT